MKVHVTSPLSPGSCHVCGSAYRSPDEAMCPRCDANWYASTEAMPECWGLTALMYGHPDPYFVTFGAEHYLRMTTTSVDQIALYMTWCIHDPGDPKYARKFASKQRPIVADRVRRDIETEFLSQRLAMLTDTVIENRRAEQRRHLDIFALREAPGDVTPASLGNDQTMEAIVLPSSPPLGACHVCGQEVDVEMVAWESDPRVVVHARTMVCPTCDAPRRRARINLDDETIETLALSVYGASRPLAFHANLENYLRWSTSDPEQVEDICGRLVNLDIDALIHRYTDHPCLSDRERETGSRRSRIRDGFASGEFARRIDSIGREVRRLMQTEVERHQRVLEQRTRT